MSPIVAVSPAERVSELCALNAHLRGEPGQFGLRAEEVGCVSRDGRVIEFEEPGALMAGLILCLQTWEDDLAAAVDLPTTAGACARFWLAFIALHPFVDKNGETGRRFLESSLAARGVRLRGWELLERCLLEGKRHDDLKKLGVAFLLGLDPRSPGFQEAAP